MLRNDFGALFLPLYVVEDSQQKRKSEAIEYIFGKQTDTITQWKQEYIRRRILAAEVYALCVQDYNLMFYLSGK